MSGRRRIADEFRELPTGKSPHETLAPAANWRERKAIRTLLHEVTKWRLTLADDPRPLRYQSQVYGSSRRKVWCSGTMLLACQC
jgi:hypothetical protein